MWRWSGVAAALVLGAALADAQDAPPGEIAAYAVFAAGEARLGPRVRVAGDAGANAAITIGRRARIDGLVASPTIDLGRRARTGDLFCVLMIGGAGPCLPVASPVVAPGALGIGLVVPGRDDVEVPRRAHRAPLEPGSYRALRLGRRSELVLTGGDYLFERVRLAPRATLRCAAECRIAVRRTLRLGSRAGIEGGPGAAVRVDVTGHGARRAVRIGRRAGVTGLVWAPRTGVAVGVHARVAGVVGATLRIGAAARIGGDQVDDGAALDRIGARR